MIKSTLIALAAAATLVSATVGAKAQAYGDRAYCDDYARRVAYRQVDPNNVVGGAIAGAVLGGAFGAITGHGQGSNIGTGLAVGGVTGGVLGAASGNGGYDRDAYNRAFWRCMHRASYQGDQPRRRAYSGRAVAYCAARYRSYNPSTGFYVSSSGAYRHCP